MSLSQSTAPNLQRSSSDLVLLTTELLETILRNLGLKDITRVQRVSQKWQEVIQGSIHLRDGEFGCPVEPTEFLTWIYEDFTASKIPNAPLVPRARIVANSIKATKASKESKVICQLHPRLSELRSMHSFAPGLTFDVDWLEMASWQVGPWMDQLVTQPPRFELVNMLDLFASTPLRAKDRRFNSLGPLTLGDLRDLLVQVFRNEAGDHDSGVYGVNDLTVRLCVAGYAGSDDECVISARQYQAYEQRMLRNLAKLGKTPKAAPVA